MSFKVIRSISDIVTEAASKETVEEQAEILRRNTHDSLALVLKSIYDEKIIWLLPNCAPPYKPNHRLNIQGAFYREAPRKIKIFIQGAGYDHLNKVKREYLFIDFLENIDASDAELMIHALTDRSFPGLSKEAIELAFPTIFN